MDFGEALRRTMFEYRITGRGLSRATGINNGQISEFRNGRYSLSIANLELVVQALEPEARAYFLGLVGGVHCTPLQGASAADGPGN